MVLITLLSLFSFPADDGPDIKIPHFDKLVHFIFYFVAAFLGSLFLRERTKGLIPLGKSILIVVLAVSLYGIIIEVLQDVYTTERSMELYDALANSLGALIGGGVIKFLFSGKRQLKWQI